MSDKVLFTVLLAVVVIIRWILLIHLQSYVLHKLLIVDERIVRIYALCFQY